MKNINRIARNTYTGCLACEYVCPANAICHKTGKFGFFYPEVSERICIDCGRCLAYCPSESVDFPLIEAECYAANWHNETYNQQSTSGGVFAAIAKMFLSKKGVVYGAAASLEMDEGYSVEHQEIENQEQIYLLQGSKYVQSSMDRALPKIGQRLKEERDVLFCGTPCQVAAVKRIFHGSDHLYTLDLVCHGVPSQQMLKDYISMIEKKNRGKVVKIEFRDKKKGWESVEGTIWIQRNNSVEELPFESFFSSYYGLFMRGETYRESCYSCQYASADRVGDITIGDFWGIEETNSDIAEKLDKKYGISVCIVNSEKGKQMMEQATMLTRVHVQLQDAQIHNQNLNEPSKHSPLRQAVLSAYSEGGWEAVDRVYLKHVGLKSYVNNRWYRMLKKIKDSILKSQEYPNLRGRA